MAGGALVKPEQIDRCMPHRPSWTNLPLDPAADRSRLKCIGAGVAQLVERHVPNVNVEGSNPFARFSHPD